MAKESYYFSHDCNARNDIKILALRSKYGAEGYAFYFMTLEILREQSDYKLLIDKYTFKTLAWQFQCDEDLIKEFIKDCCDEFGLFILEDNYLFSISLLERMEKYKETSNKMKKLAEARWKKSSNEKKSKEENTQCDSHNDTHTEQHNDTQCDSHNDKESINKINKKINKKINSFSFKEKEKELIKKESVGGMVYDYPPPKIPEIDTTIYGEEFKKRDF